MIPIVNFVEGIVESDPKQATAFGMVRNQSKKIESENTTLTVFSSGGAPKESFISHKKDTIKKQEKSEIQEGEEDLEEKQEENQQVDPPHKVKIGQPVFIIDG